jgi:hypothetical protein
LNSPAGALDGPFAEIFSTVNLCKRNAGSIKCSNKSIDDYTGRSAIIAALVAYCQQV